MAAHTLDEINDAIWRVTCACLALDTDTKATQSRVRRSWPTGEAGVNPGWKRNEDVVFFRATPVENPYATQRELVYSPQSEGDMLLAHVSMTRVWQVFWICYGPNSFNDAHSIYTNLLLPDATNILHELNVHVVPAIGTPIRVPELFNDVWWGRSDLTAQLYEGISHEYEQAPIEKVEVLPLTPIPKPDPDDPEGGQGISGDSGIHIITEKGEYRIENPADR